MSDAYCDELIRLNAEYAARAEMLEQENAALRKRVEQSTAFADALCELYDRTGMDHGPARIFREDPKLPNTSTMRWAAWLETTPEQKAYGRSGLDALRALLRLL